MRINKRLRSRIGKVLLALVAGSIIIQLSCSKKETEDPPVVEIKPKISLTSPDTSYLECHPLQVVSVTLTANSNLNTGKALSEFLITSKLDDNAFITVLDTVLTDNEFVLTDFPIQANFENGEEVWTFTVIDIAGEYFTDSITLNISGHPPALTFVGGEYEPGKSRITGDTTLIIGHEFCLGISAFSQTDTTLRRVFVQRIFESISFITLLDTVINDTTFTFDLISFAYPTPGTEVIECTVWDGYDLNTFNSLTITVTPPDPNILTFTNIELGSYDPLSPPASFASTTGEPYSLGNAADNSEIIDWIYFDGATYGHTIMAPDDDFILQVYPSVGDWPVRNSTRFTRTNITPGIFDAINNKSTLIAVISQQGTIDQSYISEMMPAGEGFIVGDVYAFQTDPGELWGLIKIIEVNQGSSNGLSTIKFDVKIED